MPDAKKLSESLNTYELHSTEDCSKVRGNTGGDEEPECDCDGFDVLEQIKEALNALGC